MLAVLAPGLGEGLQFAGARISSLLPIVGGDGLHLHQVEGEGALLADAHELFVALVPQGNLDPWVVRLRAGQAVGQVLLIDGHVFNDRIGQNAPGNRLQVRGSKVPFEFPSLERGHLGLLGAE